MSSWFNNLASQITEALPAVPDTLIPVTQNDIIDALTFQTPEMAAERKRIDQEERRKEDVKEALSRILPWETNNEDQEILVEECREAILALSGRAGAEEKNGNDDEGDGDGKDEGKDEGDAKTTEDKETTTNSIFQQPFGCGDLEGELRAMEVLEDYPRLLRVFDLDAHVGLIRRLFEVDKNLVEMHSNLSGAGEVEYNFWKNYFYHCALIRQKVGLSNSEIWDQAIAPKVSSSARKSGDKKTAPNPDDDVVTGDEGSITFESDGGGEERSSADAAAEDGAPVVVAAKPNADADADGAKKSTSTAARERSPEKDYEIVNVTASNTTTSAENSDDQGELDDLEAEIARELAG